MPFRPLRGLPIALSLSLAAPALGQDAPAAQDESPSVATIPAESRERAAFDEAFTAVKDAYRAIEKLQTEFQAADAARKEAIQAELNTMKSETQEKVNAMVEKGIAAFNAAPMADEQIADLLVSVAEHRVVGYGPSGGADQYESALPILEALVEGGHPRKEVAVWGILAAIACNEFELADRFAEVARETDAFAVDPGTTEAAQAAFGLAVRMLTERDRFREQWAKESAIRAAEAEADDLPRVKLTTSKGDLVVELFENEAPTAVANFLTLVKDGFYDGVVFHRVLAHFMAQGGDPTGSGSGGPGYAIACECYAPNARKHFRGSLSMAHAGRDTGGSQFFLTFVPTDHLDHNPANPNSGGHTVFGRVVEGIEVLGELQKVNPGERGPRPDRIISAEVLRDRGHGYEFEKLPGR